MTNLVLDGNPIVIREHHTHPDFCGVAHKPIGGVYGALRVLRGAVMEFNPDRVFIVWDDRRDFLWRRGVFPAYKVNRDRPETEDESRTRLEVERQKDLTQELAGKLGCYQLKKVGLEGDDLVYWLMNLSGLPGEWVGITIDTDWLQLVRKDVYIKLVMGQLEGFYSQASLADTGFHSPREFLFHKALMGDSSDNIEGLWRIGPKKATKMIEYIRYKAGDFADYELALSVLKPYLGPQGTELVRRNLLLMDLANTPYTAFILQALSTALVPPERHGVENTIGRLGLGGVMGKRWLMRFANLNGRPEAVHKAVCSG